jgi:hypothetical protein
MTEVWSPFSVFFHVHCLQALNDDISALLTWRHALLTAINIDHASKVAPLPGFTRSLQGVHYRGSVLA